MADPYKSGMLKKNPYAQKNPIHATLSVILDERLDERGLELMVTPSRAVLVNEIHELIATDEEDAGPGRRVDRIAYLGFMEIERAGVVVVGDRVVIGDTVVGQIAGFDPTHLPNHLNIIVKTGERKTGIELGAYLGQPVVIEKVQH